MASLESCSVGLFLKTMCHQKTHTTVKKLRDISDLREIDKEMLILRTGINASDFINICCHHYNFFLKIFENHERSCCDPRKKHKSSIKKSLRPISLDFAKSLLSKGISVKPGQKLCPQCRNFCEEAAKKSDNNESNSDNELDSIELRNTSLHETRLALDALGCSPLKLHALPSHSKALYGKRKIENVTTILQEKMSKALNYSEIETGSNEEGMGMQQKARDFDAMMALLKEKVALVGRFTKIQILTLAPESWSREKIMKVFGVSEYIVRQAKQVKKEKGILAMPDAKKGKVLSEETMKLVVDFYQNDEYSRVLPGAKDKVSIKKNVYMQKRLILSNLRELYLCFKSEYPSIKVGFSKFCNLRPKWCTLACSAGTHSVCVCSIHQNVKLLLDATHIEKSYKDLMQMLVCNLESSHCMLRHCDECPTNINLIQFLNKKLAEYYNFEDEIEISQWLNTDRAELVKQLINIEDYINLLVRKLEELLPHSFISKAQSSMLKKLKKDLSSDTVIIVMDFSENYSFIIQNEIQSYHWTRGSCTVHPVGVFLSNEREQKFISNHCFISDDLEHDVCFVHSVQSKMMKWLAKQHPQVKNVHYFTDGCAAQYKNCKSFKNLCEHFNDFSVKAEHSFFATSHGKSICDGLGGTVKRILRKACLQLPDVAPITTAAGVYSFCKSNIDNINFHYIEKKDIDILRLDLQFRFSKTRTIPGTRSFHHFKPLSSNCIEIRKTTDSQHPALVFTFDGETSEWTCVQPSINDYVAVVYDERWYFALVRNIFHEEGDVELIFLHPPGPAVSFFWPHREDCCIVPLQHLLCIVQPPQTSSSGRVYRFQKSDMKTTGICWLKWKKYMSHY